MDVKEHDLDCRCAEGCDESWQWHGWIDEEVEKEFATEDAALNAEEAKQ